MKKTTLLPFLALFALLSTSCTQQTGAPEIAPDQTTPISIYLQDDYLISSVTMIGGENITLVPEKVLLDSPATTKTLKAVSDSDLIIITRPTQRALLAKALEDFNGRLLDMSPLMSNTIAPRSEKDLTKQINIIRDTLDEMDPENHGYYFDHAGNYIHLIEDTYKALRQRMQQYNILSFITLGDDYSNIIDDFGLEKYHSKHFSVTDMLNDEFYDKFESTLKSKNTKIVLVGPRTPKDVIKKLSTYKLTTYYFPVITEDVRNWGYINYLGKMADTFAQAFDTYD